MWADLHCAGGAGRLAPLDVCSLQVVVVLHVHRALRQWNHHDADRVGTKLDHQIIFNGVPLVSPLNVVRLIDVRRLELHIWAELHDIHSVACTRIKTRQVKFDARLIGQVTIDQHDAKRVVVGPPGRIRGSMMDSGASGEAVRGTWGSQARHRALRGCSSMTPSASPDRIAG